MAEIWTGQGTIKQSLKDGYVPFLFSKDKKKQGFSSIIDNQIHSLYLTFEGFIIKFLNTNVNYVLFFQF